MQTNTTPLSNSRLQLEFELPSEQLDRAVVTAVGRLSRQVRVPGFRPGKAPRVMLERVIGAGAVVEEALDIVVADAWREAVKEQGIAPLTSPEVDVTQGEEGKPVIFKAVVQVSPEVKLGDFEHFNFRPEIGPVDETMVDKVVGELRDAEARLEPVTDGSGAQKGDYAIIAFTGLRDGQPFPGGSSERMPLILGEQRFIPGFEEELMGLPIGETREFDVVFPAEYQEESLRDKKVHFEVTLKELRRKVLPEESDEFARSVGKFADMDELREELRSRLEANSTDRARHEFADRIIDYAVANATVELPDILVDQEVEVMHDELRSALARQGISQEVYLKVSNKTEEDLHAELRPDAAKRVKTLLVLTEVARAKGVEVSDAEIQGEVDEARLRYGKSPDVLRYFESDRGRNYIRSTLRRSKTVEQLIDEWLAAHPDSPRLVHLEAARESSLVAAMAGETAVPEIAAAGA
jgi:trigger factor